MEGRGGGKTGVEPGGEFPVEDLSSGEGGLLHVCMEGVGLLFANSKVSFSMSQAFPHYLTLDLKNIYL